MQSISHRPRSAGATQALPAHSPGGAALTASMPGLSDGTIAAPDGPLQPRKAASAGKPVLRRSLSAPQPLTEAQRRMLAELGASGDLSPAEAAVLRELRFHQPPEPLDTLLFTDPNKDPDDVVAYTLGKQLQADGFLSLKEVVVTLGEADVRSQRAEMAKGIFNHLGLSQVRVSRGQDYHMDAHQAKDHGKFLAEGHALRAPPGAVHSDGLQAMRERLERAPHKLSMVVIAGMTDAHALLAAYPDLVRERVEAITIMGGVEPATDDGGLIRPDTRAYNNATDLDAARGLYRGAQELGIPLRIVTKEAAYKTAVPPAFYEGIAKSGHPVGQYLKDVQKNALKGLWEGIGAGLLPGLDTRWFFKTFVGQPQPAAEGGSPDKHGSNTHFDEIWPQVTQLNLYDPLTILAAVPGAAGMLLAPKAIQAPGRSLVELVGNDEVKHPKKAKNLMSALAKSALASGRP
ncbi:type III secretion system effector XopQ [Acidovorax sp. SUPP3334]|uniref:type III secretion system effector XopQ n=1 Tax=Acidovorax sp. SUPP3334 TaxID=2920881 RepID=UPI0023DE4CF8|nr:type III secretion system effector XopQ [Acidovorax sp. SUPP3334]GKT26554.1 nucleoside hydrolase [Acidovorax sp. SUPP3334]